MSSRLVVLVALVLACGKEKENPAPPVTTTVKPVASVSASATTVASAAPTAPKIEIEIASVGENMTFDKTKLEVPTGAHVHLVFKNNAKSEVLLHNWVLVNKGSEAKVAADGLIAGVDGQYLPKSSAKTASDVLAATPLAKPGGNTSEVTFTAPAPGAYPYICTFPGHYMMMKGVLTVTEAGADRGDTNATSANKDDAHDAARGDR